jgi:hypothetical protein
MREVLFVVVRQEVDRARQQDQVAEREAGEAERCGVVRRLGPAARPFPRRARPGRRDALFNGRVFTGNPREVPRLVRDYEIA